MNSLIIGENVAKFARSPRIWNALYKLFDIDSQMIPIDCSRDELIKRMYIIQSEKEFSSGLIASPLKDSPYWFQNQCTENVIQSRSANFFQFSPTGKIGVKNFDGPAAIESLIRTSNLNEMKRFLIYGTGPVARNIKVELMSALNVSESEICFVSRNLNIEHLSNRYISDENVISIENFYTADNNFDVLINCTPLGSPKQNSSPIKWEKLSKHQKKFFYFDVNYGPEVPKGVLGARHFGFQATDGRLMNSIQAAMAFSEANRLDCDLQELLKTIELV